MTEADTVPGGRAAVSLGAVVLAVWMAAAAASAQEGAAPPDTGRSAIAAAAGGGERWSLARCVATALERNVDARSAHARTVQARGGALGAWGGVLPTISAGLVYGYQIPDKQSSVFFVDSLAFLTKRRQQEGASAGVEANLLSLPSWSEKRRQDHLRAGAVESEAEARNGVVYAVKQQYFELLKSERLAEVSRESERLARDEEARAEALFQVGTVARGDVLKARARRAQTQLDRIRAENQVEIQRSRLKQVLGLKPETALEIEGLLDETIAVPDSASAVERALKERPELGRAGAAERAARAGLFGARAARLPQISGALSVDRTKYTNRLEQLGVAEFDDTHYATVWQGQVRLSLPIFDGFALEGGMKSAKGALLEAEAQRRQRELDVAVEVQQAWLSLREAVERIGVAKEGLASAEEDYKFSKGRYDLGAGTILDLLNAEVSLAQAKQSYVESLADAHVAEAALERAVGERRY
ncbi:MAG: TolC family protein [Candidatus Latescibacteria bacterium]|nr:TolC family protein [Candidatus Latescibacterota bacterium]